MKTLIVLVLVASLPLATMAQKSKQPSLKDSFVEFSPKLWVAKHETTNNQYKEFLSHKRKTCSDSELEAYKPDSTLWIKSFRYSFNEPWVELYNNHPGFGNHPVVNICKHVMEEYCAWRSDTYNAMPDRTYKKVVFRLPTASEWMLFSSPTIGQRLPWNGNEPYIIKDKGQIVPLANIKIKNYATGHFHYSFDGEMALCRVGKFKGNKLGLFDMVGNVAEQTADNYVKGGSWDNTIDECYIDLSQILSTPDPRVGFRLVMEVVEK
jgi:formylglycine-generating enzyme required for sulfatase activity